MQANYCTGQLVEEIEIVLMLQEKLAVGLIKKGLMCVLAR